MRYFYVTDTKKITNQNKTNVQGHNKIILCLVATQASIFNTPRQDLFYQIST